MSRNLSRTALVGLIMTTALAASQAAPAMAEPVAVDLGFSIDLPLPEITMAGLDGPGGGVPCTLSLAGTASVSRAAGSPYVVETGDARARTTCSGGVVATVEIVDISPNQRTYQTAGSSTSTAYYNGTATARHLRSQSVPYFSGTPSTSGSTRMVGYVTVQLSGRNRSVSQCHQITFVIGAGQQAVPSGGNEC